MEIFGSNQKIMLWKITLWKIMLSKGLLHTEPEKVKKRIKHEWGSNPRLTPAGVLDHYSTKLDWEESSKFLKLTLADFQDGYKVDNILGHRFFELGRVEACHWTWSFLLMFTFIFRWKKLLFYCYFSHTERLKIFGWYFQVNKKHGWRIFPNFAEVRDPFLTFFI